MIRYNTVWLFKLSLVLELSQIMGLGISKSLICDSLFKNKEKAIKIKERMNQFVWNVINASNNIEVEVPQNNPNGSYFQYSFKIGAGNNSFVIRRLLNERWWWNIQDKQSNENLHFNWTQWRKNTIIDTLPSTQEFNTQHGKPSTIGIVFPLPIAPNDSAIVNVPAASMTTYNRLQGNFHLSNKKALFLNMKAYYQSVSGEEFEVFKYLPVTFHIKDGLADPEFQKFMEYYQEQEDKVHDNKQLIKELKKEGETKQAKRTKKVRNIWIIKPGENTNRGVGIIVSSASQNVGQQGNE